MILTVKHANEIEPNVFILHEIVGEGQNACFRMATATKFVNEMAKFPEDSEERRLADSVLQVSMSANYEVFEDLKKEYPIMCDALRELMKQELEEGIQWQ